MTPKALIEIDKLREEANLLQKKYIEIKEKIDIIKSLGVSLNEKDHIEKAINRGELKSLTSNRMSRSITVVGFSKPMNSYIIVDYTKDNFIPSIKHININSIKRISKSEYENLLQKDNTKSLWFNKIKILKS